MKKFLKKPLVKSSLICILAIIIIWFMGPLIAISSHVPLKSPWIRLILILIIIIASFSSWHRKKPKKTKPSFDLNKTETQEINEALLIIKQRLQTAIKFIRQKSKKFKHKTIPWYLMLGAKDSGKTSLLAHSGLGLNSPQHQMLDKIHPTEQCNFWYHPNAVFMDLPGRMSLASNKALAQKDLRQGFFDLLSRARRDQPINGIILTLDAPSLFEESALDNLLQDLAESMTALKTLRGRIPITLVVTKCDLLQGFYEFFEDMGADDRKECLGLDFPQTKNKQQLLEAFQEQYKTLLTRLSDRLLTRLHHVPDLKTKSKLKDFPAQIEGLRRTFESLIEQLNWDDKTYLSGIYFTSSLQKGDPNNFLLKSFDCIKAVATTDRDSSLHQSQQHFFTGDLFKDFTHPEQSQLASFPTLNWQRISLYPIAIIVIGLVIWYWHHSYELNQQTIQETQQLLDQSFKIAANTHTPTWLAELNTLSTAIRQLEHKHSGSSFGFNKAKHLDIVSKKAYSAALENRFLPFLTTTLSRQIEHSIDNKPLPLLRSLKTYLMLANNSHLKPNYIKGWFKDVWAQQYPNNPKIQKDLMHHLKTLLQQPFSWQPDESLINAARQSLFKLDASSLTFLFIDDQYYHQSTPLLLTPKQNQYLALPQGTIPYIFNIKNFTLIYKTLIPQMANLLNSGSWILVDQNQSMKTVELQTLIQQTQAVYLKQYSDFWTNILNNIKFAKPNNLDDIQSMVNLLSQSDSPLWQILTTISDNTRSNLGLAEFESSVTDHFANLDSVINQTFKVPEYQAALSHLTEYLAAIAKTPDSNKACYNMAALRMQGKFNDPITNLYQEANQMPEPIATWLHHLANYTWVILLQNSEQFLNSVWQNNIYPSYQSNLENRYPLYRGSDKDISLKSFAGFFGPNGTIDNFFNYYLKPFVDTSHFYWNWKQVEGEKLPIAQSTLEMFIRASLIRQMFYTNHSTSPLVQFTLKPIKLSTNVSKFIMNLNGQMLSYSPDNKSSQSFAWPGPEASFVSLQFANTNGKNPAVSKTGPWALFRLLDESHLLATNNTRIYSVTFNAGTASATYRLTSKSMVNPFIPGILDSYRCPGKL